LARRGCRRAGRRRGGHGKNGGRFNRSRAHPELTLHHRGSAARWSAGLAINAPSELDFHTPNLEVEPMHAIDANVAC